jgi:dihydrofolate reductase
MEAAMRNLKAATLVSLDGVIGDPHVWASPFFDEQAQAKALAELRDSDAMLMGRKTYEVFSARWPTMTGDYPDRLNEMRKYVFSSTLEEAGWNNSEILRGDPAAAVAELKDEDGRDLILYGHGPLGQALLAADLIDELVFAVHPVVVGKGNLLFAEGEEARLELQSAQQHPNGVVTLSYRPVR